MNFLKVEVAGAASLCGVGKGCGHGGVPDDFSWSESVREPTDQKRKKTVELESTPAPFAPPRRTKSAAPAKSKTKPQARQINHKTKYPSGIIGAGVASMVGIADAKGRATRRMHKMLPMKKLGQAILLVLALPMFAGGIFEIQGLAGSPSLSQTIALTLGSQVMMLVAGYLDSPPKGKVGVFRAVAFTFFFIQSVPVPMAFFALFYRLFGRVDLFDSNQLVWYIVGSTTALFLLIFSAKAWNLSLWRSAKKINVRE